MSEHRNAVLLATIGVGLAAMAFVAPIAQDPTYHDFADQRTLLAIPNFWNVVSNVPFVFVGLYGLVSTPRLHGSVSRASFTVFCLGVFAVGFGSAYYHLQPTTATLFWDRLPMTIAFMALFAMVLGDRVCAPLGKALLWPLVFVGMASVLYWHWSELRGAGDLRPYVLVQFLPMLLIPLLLVLYTGNGVKAGWLWGTLVAYGTAKLAEYWDDRLYAAIGVSGHTLKHLLAGLAVFLVLSAVFRPQSAGVGTAQRPCPGDGR